MRYRAEYLRSQLAACPICGKKPKVIRDYNYELSGYGAWCTIRCKPLFRKPHLQASSGKGSWSRALSDAVTIWNERAYNQ